MGELKRVYQMKFTTLPKWLHSIVSPQKSQRHKTHKLKEKKNPSKHSTYAEDE